MPVMSSQSSRLTKWQSLDSSSGDIYLNYKETERTALGHDSCSSTEFGEAVPFYQHLWFSLSRFPSNPFHVWMIAPMCKRILVIVLLFAWVTLSEFDHTDFPVKRVYSNPTFNLDFIVRSAHHAVLQHIINLAVIIVPYSVVLVSTFHRQFF